MVSVAAPVMADPDSMDAFEDACEETLGLRIFNSHDDNREHDRALLYGNQSCNRGV